MFSDGLVLFLLWEWLTCFVLVLGIGTGAGSSIFGFLTRSTAPEDRSTVFAAVMACRQAGLLIGGYPLAHTLGCVNCVVKHQT